jgi:hypothetical protein
MQPAGVSGGLRGNTRAGQKNGDESNQALFFHVS